MIEASGDTAFGTVAVAGVEVLGFVFFETTLRGPSFLKGIIPFGTLFFFLFTAASISARCRNRL